MRWKAIRLLTLISLAAIPTLQGSMTTIMALSKQWLQLTISSKTRNRPNKSQSEPKSSSKQKKRRVKKIRVTSKLLHLVDPKLLRTRETRGATTTTESR